MLEYSIYSVISPEGCAAILWNDSTKAPDAADAIKMTADDLYRFGVIDEIVKEPLGGAHRDAKEMSKTLGEVILRHLNELQAMPADELIKKRYDKFRKLGVFSEQAV